MSRETIMQMTAEELRLEIAKKQGYKVIACNDGIAIVLNPHALISRQAYMDTGQGLLIWGDKREKPIELSEGDDYYWQELTDWTKDMQRAWELVVEMPYCELKTYKIEKIYTCRPDRRTLKYYAKAETMMLAICRAWLMWKEEQNG